MSKPWAAQADELNPFCSIEQLCEDSHAQRSQQPRRALSFLAARVVPLLLSRDHSPGPVQQPPLVRGLFLDRALSCFGREGMRREAVPEPPGSLGPVLLQGIPDRPPRWGAIRIRGAPFYGELQWVSRMYLHQSAAKAPKSALSLVNPLAQEHEAHPVVGTRQRLLLLSLSAATVQRFTKSHRSLAQCP